jgi:hypothetical protein
VTTPALVVLAGGLGQRFGGPKQLSPVGPGGEVILDYSVSGARAAGFGRVVIAVHSHIEEAMAVHIRRWWPPEVAADVIFAAQDHDGRSVEAARLGRTTPLGTAHAVLVAIEAAALVEPFAVVNADDLYGAEPYRLLFGHFTAGGEGALVSFEVAKTLLGPDPVNRALCEADEHGWLRAISEGVVARRGEHLEWTGSTGEHRTLAEDTPVSMNCWGFPPTIAVALDDAVGRFVASPEVVSRAEVLLPDVIEALVAPPATSAFTTLATSDRCLGVTHAADLDRLRPLLRPISW